MAVGLPRHDDRPRQAGRRAARPARRARARRGHDRRLLDRQRAAHELLARRRHDAVPRREEHQLGGRLPRPGGGALARPHPGAHRPERDHEPQRLVHHVPRRGRGAGHRRPAQGRRRPQRHDVPLPPRRPQPAALPDRRDRPEPALLLLLRQRRRRPARLPVRQLEDGLPRAACRRHAAGLGRAVRRAARAEDLQPAHRPLRARRHDVEHLLRLAARPRVPDGPGAGVRGPDGRVVHGVPADARSPRPSASRRRWPRCRRVSRAHDRSRPGRDPGRDVPDGLGRALPRGGAGARGRGRGVRDRAHGRHQRAVRRVRRGDGVPHRRRASARPCRLPGRPAREPRAGVDGLHRHARARSTCGT